MKKKNKKRRPTYPWPHSCDPARNCPKYPVTWRSPARQGGGALLWWLSDRQPGRASGLSSSPAPWGSGCSLWELRPAALLGSASWENHRGPSLGPLVSDWIDSGQTMNISVDTTALKIIIQFILPLSFFQFHNNLLPYEFYFFIVKVRLTNLSLAYSSSVSGRCPPNSFQRP